MVAYDEINIQESSINEKSNNTTSVMFCTGAAHLIAFRILEPYPSKDIELDLSRVILHY